MVGATTRDDGHLGADRGAAAGGAGRPQAAKTQTLLAVSVTARRPHPVKMNRWRTYSSALLLAVGCSPVNAFRYLIRYRTAGAPASHRCSLHGAALAIMPSTSCRMHSSARGQVFSTPTTVNPYHHDGGHRR